MKKLNVLLHVISVFVISFVFFKMFKRKVAPTAF